MPRLLLIEDDTVLREMLAIQLAQAGHVVRQAEDGRQAMKLFRAEPADLVITDVVMPNRDGLELIGELRREWPDLPIVAISGESRFPLYLSIAAKLGAQRVLSKPFPIDALLRAVAELIPGQSGPPADP